MLTWIDDKNQQRYFIHILSDDQWLVSSCPFNQTLSAMTVYRTFSSYDKAVEWVRERILLESIEE